MSRQERDQRRARRRFTVRACAVAAALAVIAFVVGAILDPFADQRAAEAEASSVPIARPSPEGIPSAALEPGQCLAVWTSPWASAFETTTCTGEHAAQFLAEVPADPYAGGVYPGEAALASRAQFACQSAEVIDPAAASAVEGLRIDVAYAPSALEWDAGEQSYRCFASRVGDAPITGSLARPAA